MASSVMLNMVNVNARKTVIGSARMNVTTAKKPKDRSGIRLARFGRSPSLNNRYNAVVTHRAAKMAKFTPGSCSQKRKSKAQPKAMTAIQSLLGLFFMRPPYINFLQHSRDRLAEALKRYQFF